MVSCLVAGEGVVGVVLTSQIHESGREEIYGIRYKYYRVFICHG